MVLDITEDEKKPFDREAVILTAPEYEADIYQYLKQAEVHKEITSLAVKY